MFAGPRFIAGTAAALSLMWFTLAAGGQQPAPATADAARAFVNQAEVDLSKSADIQNRADWIQSTYLTDDSNWLAAHADAETLVLAVRYAKQAARFRNTKVDEVTRRKLYLLQRQLVLPAPSRAGAAQELADLAASLRSKYSTAKITFDGKAITLDDAESILRTSRDPSVTRTLWEEWRSASGPPMKSDYARLVKLTNEGARELGYRDTGETWRSWYDMPPEQFAQKMDALYEQVKPLYDSLHCYVRGKLSQKYGPEVQPATGPIRADLLGNMWGQWWSNIYDVVAPAQGSLGYDLTNSLVAHGYDAIRLVHVADNWYQSLGFAPEPATFWERSLMTRPRDRDVVCHPSAWDVDQKQDLRIKACLTVSADDFYTVHHELGHNMYQRAYSDQSYLFRDGANDGFHEAIGDFAGLNAMTPDYLKKLGLIDQIPDANADIPYLLKMALDKIAFLPFALLVDKWRWGVFSGQITPEHYNDAWWRLVLEYQNMTPPGPRPADAFDPGAKYHVADNTPYARYFLAAIYQFQFYRAACRLAGAQGPLNRCSIYGNKEVGARFAAMLKLGASKPWQEALAAFTGERDADAGAIIEYFAPLAKWLDRQNEGNACKAN